MIINFVSKHTAPQHRNYLAYDTGVGTPSERQRRHTVERAQKAVDNITEHRLKKIKACEKNTLVGMEKHRAGDFKTRFGIDRLVEDLIQESINRGEFRDLPGMGKPLKDRATAQNPYVDFVTHKLNEVTIREITITLIYIFRCFKINISSLFFSNLVVLKVSLRY